jgi:hypothetical protein
VLTFLFYVEFEWESASPLFATSEAEGDMKGQLKLGGLGNSIVTKIKLNRDVNNTLTTKTVMESGVHRISFKLNRGTATTFGMLCGVVKDSAAWNSLHGERTSSTGWFMDMLGSLYGNGKYNDDAAGRIKEGQIFSIEANLEAGTLRFWVDGKARGPGHTSGVTGRLRFAVTVGYIGCSVQIVPTPELEDFPADCSYGTQ